MGEAQPPGPSSVPLGVRHPHHPQPGTSLPHAESRRPSRLLQRASPRKAAGRDVGWKGPVTALRQAACPSLGASVSSALTWAGRASHT